MAVVELLESGAKRRVWKQKGLAGGGCVGEEAKLAGVERRVQHVARRPRRARALALTRSPHSSFPAPSPSSESSPIHHHHRAHDPPPFAVSAPVCARPSVCMTPRRVRRSGS